MHSIHERAHAGAGAEAAKKEGLQLGLKSGARELRRLWSFFSSQTNLAKPSQTCKFYLEFKCCTRIYLY